MSRDPALPPNQDSNFFVEAPGWPNRMVEIGCIGRYTPIMKTGCILWAFGSTVVANYGPLCDKKVELSASELPELPKSGLFGYKNGR